MGMFQAIKKKKYSLIEIKLPNFCLDLCSYSKGRLLCAAVWAGVNFSKGVSLAEQCLPRGGARVSRKPLPSPACCFQLGQLQSSYFFFFSL